MTNFRKWLPNESQLEILNAEWLDQGYYRCQVREMQKTIESGAWLIIRVKKKGVEKKKSSFELPDFSDLSFDIDTSLSDSNGVFDDLQLKEKDDFSHLRVLQNVNSVKNGETERSGVCELYIGYTCSKFLKNQYIYIPNNLSQEILERHIQNAVDLISLFKEIQNSCSQYTLPILCHHTFPICNTLKSKPNLSLLCEDECEMIEKNICHQEYSLASKHSELKYLIPDCSKLPSMSTLQATKCIRVGVENLKHIKPHHTCFSKRGAAYAGVVSKSRSGAKCKNWLSTNHHSALNLKYNHNYCRNFKDSSFKKPWCYTNANATILPEICSIPRCENDAYLNMTDFTNLILISGFSLIAFFFILVFFIFFCCRKKRKRREKNEQSLTKYVDSERNQVMQAATLLRNKTAKIALPAYSEVVPLQSKQMSITDSFVTPPNINPNNIVLLQELGKGEFSIVYSGELITSIGSTNGLTRSQLTKQRNIAIKMLQSPSLHETRKASNSENHAAFIFNLNHPNLIEMIGTSIIKECLCLVYAFDCDSWDLHQFLIMHSPNYTCSDSGIENVINDNDLCMISSQIANALSYLCEKKFVHGDVATRNILIGKNYHTKVSLLDHTLETYSSCYFNGKPLRWMSPEAIMYNHFSSESDAWSFGITLWEIYSFGLEPYYGYQNSEVADLVTNQQLLTCPDACPEYVYTIMLECWHNIPSQRIAFRKAHIKLLEIAESNNSRNGCGCNQKSVQATNQNFKLKDWETPSENFYASQFTAPSSSSNHSKSHMLKENYTLLSSPPSSASSFKFPRLGANNNNSNNYKKRKNSESFIYSNIAQDYAEELPTDLYITKNHSIPAPKPKFSHQPIKRVTVKIPFPPYRHPPFLNRTR